MEGYTHDNLLKSFGEIRDYIRKPNTYNDDVTYEVAFLEFFLKKKIFTENPSSNMDECINRIKKIK